MKRSRFIENQIVNILKEADAGAKETEVRLVVRKYDTRPPSPGLYSSHQEGHY